MISSFSLMQPARQCVCCAIFTFALAGAALAGNLTGRFATITLDGSLSDWQPGDSMYAGADIANGTPGNSTFTNVYVANDSTNLYVAFAVPQVGVSVTNAWAINLFIDTDVNPATGMNSGWMSRGYDRLVQWGLNGTTYSIFSFNGTSQADWAWNWLQVFEYSYSDQVVEWSIPLSALGLTTNYMYMEFNVSGAPATETWAYKWESGVSSYTLASNNPAPLAVSSVAAAVTKVQVNFSKALDPTSAGAKTNYSLSGGLAVLGAALNPTDNKQVILTTTAQTRGSPYVLTVNGVKDASGVAISPNTRKPFISSIIIDGSFDDWAGLDPLYLKSQGDPAGTDFKEVYAYNDNDYIYFRLTLWEPSEFLSPQNNLFIDTDNNSGTGNSFWGGSELLIQNGSGYQEKNGGFNEGQINGLNWLLSTAGNTNYEFRVSRAATYASDGLPVFTAETVNFAFDAETNWVTANRMPETSGATIPFNLVQTPAFPPGPLSISLSNGVISVSWPDTATLEASGSVIGGWTNVPSATSPYTTTASGQRSYFRLVK